MTAFRQEVLLRYKAGESDKGYRIVATDSFGGTFRVFTEYGRWNRLSASGKEGEYSSREDAIKAFNRLLKAKTAKGYKIINATPAIKDDAPQPKATPKIARRAKPIDVVTPHRAFV